VRKPTAGEHSRRTPEEAGRLIREMATRWSDADIAATLTRMGIPTGYGNTWTAGRVAAYRHNSGIFAYASGQDGRYLTALDAARQLGASCYLILKLIHAGILPARQVMSAAPWQILASDLERPEVQQALRRRRQRPGHPCRNSGDDRTLTIPGTSRGAAQ